MSKQGSIVEEGNVKLRISVPEVVSKDMPQFYNPVMKLNRDISILLLTTLKKDIFQIALPLAGTGIRGLRFLKELKAKKIKAIYFNDYNSRFKNKLTTTLKQNKIELSKKINVSMKDANLFLLESKGFDYIDIDPFGTPNPFLDSAVKRIARDGILAVTATDTSALAGSFKNACRRKYWAEPINNSLMREFGIRILARKIQLIGAQYDKALIPIFSHSSNHYMRIYFRCDKGKSRVDELLKQHKQAQGAGPIYIGELWDRKLTKDIFKNFKEKNKNMKNIEKTELYKLLKTIAEESQLGFPFFYDIHNICKSLKLQIPKAELIIREIKKQKHKVSLTHFNNKALKSTISEDKLKQILKRLNW